jgi:hypothetical protein
MDNHTHESALQNRNTAVSLRSLVGLCAVAAVMAGCAAVSLGRSDKEVVAERAQERWNELVKGNFAAAYGYMSPAGRELVSLDAYASGLRRGFWTGAKVDKVECATDESCEVDVSVEYQHRGLKMKTPVREKWIKQRLNWWFLLQR